MTDTPTLGEIFDLDPLSLTKDGPEIEAIIADYRAKRFKYNTGDMKAGAPARTPKALEGVEPSLMDKFKVNL